MDDSILTSVKNDLGMTEEYEAYDEQIIGYINTVFVILYQMGIGPDHVFSIKDKTSTWNEFTEENSELDAVKTYMYQRVKMIFDPPQNSSHMDALKETSKELEWRLYTASNEYYPEP